MSNPTLITDLDNTLYNWTDFFGPSFRAMVHALSARLEVEEEILLDQFRDVFAKYGTLEYSFSIQELKSVRGLPKEEVDRMVHLGRVAFGQVRRRRLKAYPDVAETLAWIAKAGVRVIGLTNAPLLHAARRLRHLGVISFFSGLAGWEGHDIPEDGLEATDSLRAARERGRERLGSKKLQMMPLPLGELKPNRASYERLISRWKLVPEETFVVGDSLGKDLAPAQSLGLKTIWAAYGKEFERKNLDTLLRITHWSAERVATTYDETTFTPDHVIGNFSEVVQYLLLPQQSLFLDGAPCSGREAKDS